jgi:hypothetical protein
MMPVSPNDHKWEVFLKTFAEDVQKATTPALVEKIVENLTIIDQKCDRIAQIVKRSPTCYNDFQSAIVYSFIKSAWNANISKLLKSIEMNLPTRTTTTHQYPKEIQLKSPQSFSQEILVSVSQVVADSEFLSTTPDYKKIDRLFGQLHALVWKTLTIPKDSAEYKEIVNHFNLLLDNLAKLFTNHIGLFNSKNGIAFYSVLISHCELPLKIESLLGFLKYHSDEFLLRHLLHHSDKFNVRHLERFNIFFNPLKRDIDCVIAILKVDKMAAENFKNLLKSFCEEYLKLEFTEEHRVVLLTYFDLLFHLNERMPELLDPQTKAALEDTITICFDAGPLCLRKHQFLLMCKSSYMLNELIFGGMRETVEFAESKTICLKEICRNDFRLMVQRYYSVSEQGELEPKQWIKLASLSEFLDIKFIREDTKVRLQKFAESFRTSHVASADCESCAALETLARTLSKLNLSTALEGFLPSLKLPDLLRNKQAFNETIVESKNLAETQLYFYLFGLYYSLIKKHFPERLKEVHEKEVAPLIKSIFNISLSHPEQSYRVLCLLRDALSVQPFEKTVEFNDAEFDDFVVMPTKPLDVLIDLDLSEYPVKLKTLEALKGLFIGKLHLKKGNFSTRELMQVGKFFSGVVVTFKE